jgi:bile acid:Na+ symporter, BASS family
MKGILKIVNHRDFVLVLAIVVGLSLGERTKFLADMSVYSLALVMVFSTTGFSFKSWVPFHNALRTLLLAALLNYFLFGAVLIGLAWLFFRGEAYAAYFTGFVLLAAAPPGPSAIPFSAMLKGDSHFAVTGVFGLHLLAMVLTPAILLIFIGQSLIHPTEILMILVKLIVIPLVISRLMRHPRILPGVEKVRDTVIKWGFFLVIAPIMGMSAPLFYSQPVSVVKISLVVVVAMYVLGFAYHVVMDRFGRPRPFIVSSTLLMVTKSSAFAAVVAFSFFGSEPGVALPSAVVSLFVTLFIIFYSRFTKWYDKAVS